MKIKSNHPCHQAFLLDDTDETAEQTQSELPQKGNTEEAFVMTRGTFDGKM